jgi:hypothetical protein
MQLLKLKSITRYFPEKGKDGFGLEWQRTPILSPLPPASITAVVFTSLPLTFLVFAERLKPGTIGPPIDLFLGWRHEKPLG